MTDYIQIRAGKDNFIVEHFFAGVLNGRYTTNDLCKGPKVIPAWARTLLQALQNNQRCAVCGWPLERIQGGVGCERGNCSMHPLPEILFDPERAERERPPYSQTSFGSMPDHTEGDASGELAEPSGKKNDLLSLQSEAPAEVTLEAEATLEELIEKTRHHVITPKEAEAQRQSWVRGEMEMAKDEREQTRVLPEVSAPSTTLEQQVAALAAENEHLRVAIREMLAVAKVDGWDKATTGRQIIYADALELVKPGRC